MFCIQCFLMCYGLKKITFCLFAIISLQKTFSQPSELQDCNITWTSQSKNSSESMPCGGGSIGLNVWSENNEVLFYISRSGSFDENNALLKSGRVRLKVTPNPFSSDFKQELDLKSGAITITGTNNKNIVKIKIWVDVFHPVIHVETNSTQPVTVEASFESWRYQDRPIKGRENNANSWKWAPQGEVKTHKDEIDFDDNGILFFHRNNPTTVFDATVKQEGMDMVKDELFNPLKNLTFGGRMLSKEMRPVGNTTGNYIDTDFKGWTLISKKPAKKQTVQIYLHTAQSNSIEEWKDELNKIISGYKKQTTTQTATINWWKEFWNRSFIFIHPGSRKENESSWQTGRNYQLFRYMLACNAFGDYPTKFNGGLFTYDPVFIDTSLHATPDFRNWG